MLWNKDYLLLYWLILYSYIYSVDLDYFNIVILIGNSYFLNILLILLFVILFFVYFYVSKFYKYKFIVNEINDII